MTRYLSDQEAEDVVIKRLLPEETLVWAGRSINKDFGYVVLLFFILFPIWGGGVICLVTWTAPIYGTLALFLCGFLIFIFIRLIRSNTNYYAITSKRILVVIGIGELPMIAKQLYLDKLGEVSVQDVDGMGTGSLLVESKVVFSNLREVEMVAELIQDLRSQTSETSILKEKDELCPPEGMLLKKEYTELLNLLEPLAENKDNLRRLNGQINSNGIIPFVGEGCSIPFGIPSWDNFLLEIAEKRGLKNEIKVRLDAKEYEEAAEELLNEYGARGFQDKIEAAFGKHKLAGKAFANEAVSVLPRLAVGPVITTNFDQVIEEAFKQSNCPFDQVVIGTKPDLIGKALQSGNRFLLKVHGDVEDRADRILTFTEYQNYYGTTSNSLVDLTKPLPVHLKAMMTNRPLLFLGCNLRQDRMMAILAHIAETVPGLVHYAIVVKPEKFEEFRVQSKRLADFGIRPIWYPENEDNLIKPLLEYLVLQRAQPIL